MSKEKEFDEEEFGIWWFNEGSFGRTKEQKNLDNEELIHIKCREAWLNGASKARELIEKESYKAYKNKKEE